MVYTQPQNLNAAAGMNVAFSFSPSGTSPMYYQWRFNGSPLPGATNTVLSLNNVQPANAGTYSVVVTNIHGSATSSNVAFVLGPVAVWSSSGCGPCGVPVDVTNAVAISGYYQHFLVLRPEGTVRSWGRSDSGQTNVPSGLSNVVALSTSDMTSLALKADGTVTGWGAGAVNTGYPQVGQLMFPPGLTNVLTLASGAWHCLALKRDGTVAAWGSDAYGQTDVPPVASNIVGIAGGWGHSLALRGDGQVIGWGAGVTNGPFPHLGQCMVPTGLSNVVAIAANGYHSLALKSDGTVVAWGAGQTNSGSFPDFGQAIVPNGLSNVVAISAAFFGSLALKSNGKLVTWGSLMSPDAGLGGVTAIEGGNGWMALETASAPFIVTPPVSQTIPAGGQALLAANATGKFPLAWQWQLNGTNLLGATNRFLMLTNSPLAASGDYGCLASNASGSATSAVATVTVVRQPLEFLVAPGNPQLTAGGFQMRVGGLAGSGSAIIYASTNLLDWEAIFTNPPLAGSLDFLDTEATNRPARFYRAVETSR